jgi:hypothetical protein
VCVRARVQVLRCACYTNACESTNTQHTHTPSPPFTYTRTNLRHRLHQVLDDEGLGPIPLRQAPHLQQRQPQVLHPLRRLAEGGGQINVCRGGGRGGGGRGEGGVAAAVGGFGGGFAGRGLGAVCVCFFYGVCVWGGAGGGGLGGGVLSSGFLLVMLAHVYGQGSRAGQGRAQHKKQRHGDEETRI